MAGFSVPLIVREVLLRPWKKASVLGALRAWVVNEKSRGRQVPRIRCHSLDDNYIDLRDDEFNYKVNNGRRTSYCLVTKIDDPHYYVTYYFEQGRLIRIHECVGDQFTSSARIIFQYTDHRYHPDDEVEVRQSNRALWLERRDAVNSPYNEHELHEAYAVWKTRNAQAYYIKRGQLTTSPTINEISATITSIASGIKDNAGASL